jgi:hypothetical protein
MARQRTQIYSLLKENSHLSGSRREISMTYLDRSHPDFLASLCYPCSFTLHCIPSLPHSLVPCPQHPYNFSPSFHRLAMLVILLSPTGLYVCMCTGGPQQFSPCTATITLLVCSVVCESQWVLAVNSVLQASQWELKCCLPFHCCFLYNPKHQ